MHYVALSRATKLSGLFITNLNEEAIKVDPKVQNTMEQLREYYKLELCYRPVTYLEDEEHLNSTEINKIIEEQQYTIKILYQNVRSLPYHFQDIRVDTNYTSADILILAETRLIQSDNNNTFNLDDYIFYRNDQPCNTVQRPYHGMAIYINSDLSITHVYNFSKPDFEAILLNATKNTIDFQVLGIYKQPKTTYQQLKHYLQSLEPLLDKNLPLLITGDFNINVSDESPKIISYMNNKFNCYQTTPQITTIRDTAIDLTFTNVAHCTTDTIFTPWTDHYLVYNHIPFEHTT